MKKMLLSALVCMAVCLTACGTQITSVTLPEHVTLEKGGQQTLELVFAAKDGTTQEAIDEAVQKLTLTWMSSDEAVIQVDETGCVTAVAPGEADVTVTAGDDLTASCRVAVIVPLTGIDVPEELQLFLGGEDEAALTASPIPADATGVEISYSSSDEAVATVGEDGTVRAVGMGECVILTEIKAPDINASGAESENSKVNTGIEFTSETRVTVSTVATGITLSSEGGKLYVGNSANVQVYTSPVEADAAVAADVKYTSSDESVATVAGTTEGAAGFTIKGVGVGSATITVEYNGLTATYAVSVTKYVAPQQTTSGTGSTGGSATTSGSTGSSTGGSSGGGQASTPAPQPSTPSPDTGSSGGSTGGASSSPPDVVYGPGAGVGMPGDTIIGGGGHYPPDVGDTLG